MRSRSPRPGGSPRSAVGEHLRPRRAGDRAVGGGEDQGLAVRGAVEVGGQLQQRRRSRRRWRRRRCRRRSRAARRPRCRSSVSPGSTRVTFRICTSSPSKSAAKLCTETEPPWIARKRSATKSAAAESPSLPGSRLGATSSSWRSMRGRPLAVEGVGGDVAVAAARAARRPRTSTPRRRRRPPEGRFCRGVARALPEVQRSKNRASRRRADSARWSQPFRLASGAP